MAKAPKTPSDPEQIFRHALCFDYTAQHLSHINAMIQFTIAGKHGWKVDYETPSAEGGSPRPVGVTMPKDQMNRVPTAFPMGVLRAFMTELYLKCLLALNGTPIPGKHELTTLFRLLEPRQQKRMEELFDERNRADGSFQELQAQESSVKFTLDHVLTQMNDVFKTWRYAYEPGLNWEASLIAEPWAAAGLLIIEERPDWMPILEEHCTLPTFQVR